MSIWKKLIHLYSIKYIIMSKLFKLGLAVVGFTIAMLVSSQKLSASNGIPSDGIDSTDGAGCVGEKGICGRTPEGTTLYGKWREW